MTSGKRAGTGLCAAGVLCAQQDSTWLGSAPHLRAELLPSAGEPREPRDLLTWMLGDRKENGTSSPAEPSGAPKPGQQNPIPGHPSPVVKLHVLNVLPPLPRGP